MEIYWDSPENPTDRAVWETLQGREREPYKGKFFLKNHGITSNQSHPVLKNAMSYGTGSGIVN